MNAEDIAIEQNTGIALIYSSEFDDIHNAKRGDIWMIDLKRILKTNQACGKTRPSGFRRYGISFYQSSEGIKKLFVVNYRK